MDKNRFKASGSSVWAKWPTAIAVSLAIGCTAPALAQAPAAPGGAAAAPAAQTSEQLVGRIALYPDDLVAIILPAATNPLQLVQADRFLEKRKTDPKAAMDAKWDDAVKSLLNYPDVVKMMSGDLDWTSALGEAVVADQGAVLEAVQAFRRKAVAAGNLKSDAKQTIVVEKEVIKIVPADPQVVYVPQYNPSTVVVVSAAPVYGYYPTPYPAYAYPYAPGAAMAAGVIWGAAIGAAQRQALAQRVAQCELQRRRSFGAQRRGSTLRWWWRRRWAHSSMSTPPRGRRPRSRRATSRPAAPGPCSKPASIQPSHHHLPRRPRYTVK